MLYTLYTVYTLCTDMCMLLLDYWLRVYFVNQCNVTGYYVLHAPSSKGILYHKQCFILSMACILYEHQMCIYCVPRLHLWILFWLYGGYMSLLINDQNLLYFHMDALRSFQLRYHHFASPDSMNAWIWISFMLLHSDYITLAGPSLYIYNTQTSIPVL